MFENVRITKLQNGACVATSKMPGVNSCSVCFSIPMGSRREKLSEAGWSHFAEHMAFKGAAKYPTKAIIDRALNAIGGSVEAYTLSLDTWFYTRVPAKWTAKAIEVLGDIVARPIFPDAEIEKERKVIVEESKRDFDPSPFRIKRLANGALWPGHPLGRPIIGSEKSRLKIDRKSLLAFHGKHYTAKGAIFAAAGNLNHDQIVDMVSPALYSLSDRPETPYLAVSRCQPVTPVVFEHRDMSHTNFRISFRAPDDATGWGTHLVILSKILSSRLMHTVREKYGMVYYIDSFVNMYVDTSVFVVEAMVDTNNLIKTIALCGREQRKMVKSLVGRHELKEAKDWAINSALLEGEESSSQMKMLVPFIRKYGSVITTADKIKMYESVTAQGIQQFASEIFRPENCSLAMFLPNNGQVSPEKLRESLFS